MTRATKSGGDAVLAACGAPATPPDAVERTPLAERVPWREPLALPPRKGYAYERVDKGGVLYAEQWSPVRGNWRRASLAAAARAAGFDARLVDAKGKRLTGRARNDRQAWARGAAVALFRQWDTEDQQAAGPTPAVVADVPGGLAPAAARGALTLGETEALLLDPDTGKFPTPAGRKPTHHAREVLRSLRFAVRELGADFPWARLDIDAFTTLWRRRIRQAQEATKRGERQDGLRPAEVIVRDLAAVATWLRQRRRDGEPLIPAGAALLPRTWKRLVGDDWVKLRGEELRTRTAPEPKRPRHTEDEIRRILARAADVDPRLDLLLQLGAELRPGQVERAMRTHLDLTVAPHGRLTVQGAGTKKGTKVKLTAGQRAAVDRALGLADPARGYLRLLEQQYAGGALADYPLFPAGQLPGGRKGEDPVATSERHVTCGLLAGNTIRDWFREAEALAGVPSVKGRVFYGVRRAAVDAFKARQGSREGLQAFGGWADTQIPDTIYADAEAEYAQDEAAKHRAAIRGEAPEAAAAEASEPPARASPEGIGEGSPGPSDTPATTEQAP